MWAQSTTEIGRIIATARKSRGLTQAKLAQALGTTQNWISDIERGKDTAQIGKVLRVLSYLGVRLEVGEAPWVATPKATPDKPTGTSLDDIVTAHSKGARRRRRIRRRRRRRTKPPQ